jgi:superfamily II DNA or RNA helicase
LSRLTFAPFDPRVVEEVRRSVLDQGRLSKEDIVAGWGLDDRQYAELQRRLLGRPGVEAGPQRVGGFVARRPSGPSAEAAGSVPPLAIEPWEAAAIERLVALLPYAALEGLLGGLLHTIRQLRRLETGENRRGTKEELAGALVVQHGRELFRVHDAREQVGRAAGLEWPKRWFPGKDAAVEFVRGAGFPVELAGTPSPETPPHFEYLEGRVELKPLHRFQKEVHRKLLERLYQPGDRCLLTLPTGAGKTRVTAESIRHWLTDRYDGHSRQSRHATALWLAHTEELCEQAYQCFRQIWDATVQPCPLLLVRFWGRFTSEPRLLLDTVGQARVHPTVLVSTPNRVLNLLRGHVEGGESALIELFDSLGLLVIDEAHRAAAKSYRDVLTALDRVGRPVSVVGLTATPYRMEYMTEDPEAGTRELREIFGRLLEPSETLGPNPRVRLQELEVLARPRFVTLETPTSLSIPNYDPEAIEEEVEIERIDRVLALRTDNSARRLAVLERLVTVAREPDSSTLYFGPSVRDAECMAYLLRARGVPAAVVSGDTRDVARRQMIDEFRRARVRVLCNCEVLTTGFDAPRVTHIFMARPTVSQVLYEQMVGRGLRGPAFGGTGTCTIIDCKDDIRGPRPELGYEAFRKVWS